MDSGHGHFQHQPHTSNTRRKSQNGWMFQYDHSNPLHRASGCCLGSSLYRTVVSILGSLGFLHRCEHVLLPLWVKNTWKKRRQAMPSEARPFLATARSTSVVGDGASWTRRSERRRRFGFVRSVFVKGKEGYPVVVNIIYIYIRGHPRESPMSGSRIYSIQSSYTDIVQSLSLVQSMLFQIQPSHDLSVLRHRHPHHPHPVDGSRRNGMFSLLRQRALWKMLSVYSLPTQNPAFLSLFAESNVGFQSWTRVVCPIYDESRSVMPARKTTTDLVGEGDHQDQKLK